MKKNTVEIGDNLGCVIVVIALVAALTLTIIFG